MAESSASRWCTRLQVCGKKILFKVDTGADVTVITEETYKFEVASQADPANDMPVQCKRKAGNNRMLRNSVKERVSKSEDKDLCRSWAGQQPPESTSSCDPGSGEVPRSS